MTDILKRNIESEKLLKELKIDPKNNGREINELLILLRNNYQELLINHPSLIVGSSKKDIDSLLWKTCYYKQIEEFRKSIKKSSQILNDNNADISIREKAKIHISKLLRAFSKFLADASSSYLDLMQKLELKVQSLQSKLTENEDLTNLILSISRCLLYLGDLARYSSLYSESDTKIFTEAEKYYKRAAFLIPEYGNPWNQLAVLATYEHKDLDAVYFYCRSVLCKSPFASGIDNLMSVFEKYSITHFSEMNVNNHNKVSRRNKEDNMRLKQLHQNILKLLAILFSWNITSRRIVEKMQASNDTIDTYPVIPVASIDMDQFNSLLNLIDASIESLIMNNALDDDKIIQIVLLCIFSVDFLSTNRFLYDLNQLGNASNLNVLKGQRIISESCALTLLFTFVTRMIKLSCKMTINNDKATRTIAFRPISAFSLFVEWLENSSYLETFNSHDLIESEEVKSLIATSAMISSENMSRSNMKSCILILQDFVDSNIRQESSSSYNNKVIPSKYHLELRGYAPINDYLETFFQDCKALDKFPPVMLSEKNFKLRKFLIIRDFIQKSSKKLGRSATALFSNSISLKSNSRDTNSHKKNNDKKNKKFKNEKSTNNTITESIGNSVEDIPPHDSPVDNLDGDFSRSIEALLQELRTPDFQSSQNLMNEINSEDFEELDDDMVVFRPAFSQSASNSSLNNIPGVVMDNPIMHGGLENYSSQLFGSDPSSFNNFLYQDLSNISPSSMDAKDWGNYPGFHVSNYLNQDLRINSQHSFATDNIVTHNEYSSTNIDSQLSIKGLTPPPGLSKQVHPPPGF